MHQRKERSTNLWLIDDHLRRKAAKMKNVWNQIHSPHEYASGYFEKTHKPKQNSHTSSTRAQEKPYSGDVAIVRYYGKEEESIRPGVPGLLRT